MSGTGMIESDTGVAGADAKLRKLEVSETKVWVGGYGLGKRSFRKGEVSLTAPDLPKLIVTVCRLVHVGRISTTSEGTASIAAGPVGPAFRRIDLEEWGEWSSPRQIRS